MTQGYQINNSAATYFLTFQIVDWVDIFTRSRYKDIIIESFTYCQKNKGLVINAYVIMTNHVHLITSAKHENLSDVIRDFKKFTSVRLLEATKDPGESRRDWMLKRFEFAARSHVRNSHYQLWTHENHAIELHNPEMLKQKIDYIHNNPVCSGWVEKEEEYLYSSARNYYGLSNKLEVDFISPI